MILDRIVAHKQKQVEMQKQIQSISGFKQQIIDGKVPPISNFYQALKGSKKMTVIGEVKKASPSKGVLCHHFEPVKIAYEYYKSGIEAISVLTESEFFMGSDAYLVAVRENVPVPILRKDFIIDSFQIYQARVLGASAILLIAAILTDEQLVKFQIIANILGMDCLVETHDEREVERALKAEAKIIGINNRDLKTFETDIDTTARLMKHLPKEVLVVSESGIKTHQQMQYLEQLGVNAVLIGETLVRQQDNIEQNVKELRNGKGKDMRFDHRTGYSAS